MITEGEAREWKQHGRTACLTSDDPLNAQAAYDAMMSAYLQMTVPLGSMTFLMEAAMEFAWGWEQALQGRNRIVRQGKPTAVRDSDIEVDDFEHLHPKDAS